MARLKVGVVGTGRFGRNHVRCLGTLSELCEVTALFDRNPDHCAAVSAESGVAASPDLGSLIRSVDAVFVAVSTLNHAAVGEAVLRGRRPLFMEKPVAAAAAEAGRLVALAAEHKVPFQVGHIERYNPAFTALMSALPPLTLEAVSAERLSPWPGREAEVSVVHDVMIHDIDLCLTLIDSPVTGVRAQGKIVRSATLDECRATLEFENKVSAVLTASRVSAEKKRKMAITSEQGACLLDFGERTLQSTGLPEGTFLPVETDVDMLQEEFRDFLMNVIEDRPVQVTGESALRALEIADRVVEACGTGK